MAAAEYACDKIGRALNYASEPVLSARRSRPPPNMVEYSLNRATSPASTPRNEAVAVTTTSRCAIWKKFVRENAVEFSGSQRLSVRC